MPTPSKFPTLPLPFLRIGANNLLLGRLHVACFAQNPEKGGQMSPRGRTQFNIVRSVGRIHLSASPAIVCGLLIFPNETEARQFDSVFGLPPVQVAVLERMRVTRKDPLSYITSDSNPPGQCFMITAFHHWAEEEGCGGASPFQIPSDKAGRNLAQICNNNSLRAHG